MQQTYQAKQQPVVRRSLRTKCLSPTESRSLALRQTLCVHNLFWKRSLENRRRRDVFASAVHFCPEHTVVFRFPCPWPQATVSYPCLARPVKVTAFQQNEMMKTDTNALLGGAFPSFHGRHAVTQDEKKEQDKSQVHCYIVHVLVKQQNPGWKSCGSDYMQHLQPWEKQCLCSVILEMWKDHHWGEDFEMKRQCSWSTLLNASGKAADP